MFSENLIKKERNKNIWQSIYEAMDSFPKEYPRQKLLKYSTNIPFLFTCMETLKHDKIIEFGSGLFSTRVLYEYFLETFLVVEDEKDWFKKMKKEYGGKQGFSIICPGFYFGDPGPGRKLSFNDLTNKQKRKIRNFYNNLVKNIDNVDFTFVDQVPYCRGQSILAILNKTNIIVYHDTQAIIRHNYDVIDDILKSNKYKLYSYKTIPSWTNILIPKKHDFNEKEFISVLKEREKTYFDLISSKEPMFKDQLYKTVFKFERLF